MTIQVCLKIPSGEDTAYLYHESAPDVRFTLEDGPPQTIQG